MIILAVVVWVCWREGAKAVEVSGGECSLAARSVEEMLWWGTSRKVNGKRLAAYGEGRITHPEGQCPDGMTR
jgi:hypothetical protein